MLFAATVTEAVGKQMVSEYLILDPVYASVRFSVNVGHSNSMESNQQNRLFLLLILLS
jgi:hypothetical protein